MDKFHNFFHDQESGKPVTATVPAKKTKFLQKFSSFKLSYVDIHGIHKTTGYKVIIWKYVLHEYDYFLVQTS